MLLLISEERPTQYYERTSNYVELDECDDIRLLLGGPSSNDHTHCILNSGIPPEKILSAKISLDFKEHSV